MLELGRVLEARLGVEEVPLAGVAPVAALGEDLAAGEKLIFVCRLRSRAFFAMMVDLAAKRRLVALVGKIIPQICCAASRLRRV